MLYTLITEIKNQKNELPDNFRSSWGSIYEKGEKHEKRNKVLQRKN